AFVLLKDHDAKAALPALRYVTKEYPKVASYQVWLGQALGQTGDRAGARAAYRMAAELLPGDESAGDNRSAYKYLIEKGFKDLCPVEPPKDRCTSPKAFARTHRFQEAQRRVITAPGKSGPYRAADVVDGSA